MGDQKSTSDKSIDLFEVPYEFFWLWFRVSEIITYFM